jgi:hypothetical protein
LTLTSAWRSFVLTIGLVLAFIHPGVVPGAYAADKENGSISGTVIVEGGGSTKPVANAEVRMTFGSKSDARKTSADGKFSFGDLLAGKYTLRVTAPDGMKPKGDGSVSITVSPGDAEQLSLVLVSLATPTPTSKVTATSSPAARLASTPGPQANAPSSNGSIPILLNPLASPVTAQPSPVTNQQARANQAAQSAAAAVQAVASPGALDLGSSSLIFAVSSPTPPIGPAGTSTATPDDVVASGPPRRLITSFEALRATAGGGSASPLRTSATDNSLVLGVPFKTQIDGTSFSLVNCGPASLAMVLIAFGLDVDPPSVRDYLNYKVGNYDTEQGTSLYTLAQIAKEAGLSTFGTSSGLVGWTVNAIRDQIRAGHPVITLTKYRRLPGHFGSVTEFDHYIVLTGLAGDDFVYNDAAYSTEYGYNLLISPAQLERAWADSSVPRHAVAIGYGDSLRPLPIVPNRLMAANLAITAPTEADDVQVAVADVVAPTLHVNRGPAAELLREQMLDQLGARTSVRSGEPTIQNARSAPQTRLDPAEVAVQERPSGLAVADSTDPALLAAKTDGQLDTSALGAAAPDGRVQTIADARLPGAPVQAAAPSDGQIARVVRTRPTPPAALLPLGLALMSVGLLLVAGGNAVGWRRGERPAWAAALVEERRSWRQVQVMPLARLVAQQATASASEWLARLASRARGLGRRP